MKKINSNLYLLAIFAFLFTSCSKDENSGLTDDPTKAQLSFGAILNDIESGRASEKSHTSFLDEVPECSDEAAAYVEIILSRNGVNVVGSEATPHRVNLAAGQIFTVEDAALELEPDNYSLEYFAVYGASGEMIWLAPYGNGGNLSQFVDTALPISIDLGAGVKKYVEVDVLCYDDRGVNEYGYLFFDVDQNRAMEFCIFGNFCDDTGRHYPAQYSVDVWSYANGILGDQLYEDVYSDVYLNNDGDYAASPVCFALPDTEGMDEYYFEITIRNSDAYGDVDERVIRAGVINDDDVRDLMGDNDDVDYYHFREGNCGDMEDFPNFFNSEYPGLFAFVDDYADSFFNIEPFPALTPIYPSLTIEDAYDFQVLLNIELQQRGLEEISGYKLGFTADMKPFGAPKPIYGRLYSSFEVPNGTTLSISEDFIRGSVGYEVAIIIGKDIRTAISPEEAKDAVKAIAPAFEFADFAFNPNNEVIDFRDIIATNSAARTYILGEETLLENLLDQGINPNQIEVTGTLDGNVILEAAIGLPVDGIFQAVSFLSQELASTGSYIKAGDIILTGAIKGNQLDGPGTYVGDYGILGSIRVTLVE
ncbi:fumarylacetoacetate hydrolase family protein [Zunongwangia sp. F260]|uniref:Fumarylacetoacetate hydrolase family protein n=1 Tax=Autumnicola lenta TaxID=3075593 RepID=A0ABU3CQ92_9FLAO|nr:fumarylacetoacetate hydrolase family protein [Zunongwangia sp. F260]MDT0648451.1 fumarylacetoacetate hydrolase family protein [Zunongwangia sp. F260]